MLILLLLIASSIPICLGDWFPVIVTTPEPIDPRSRMLKYKRANKIRLDGEQKAYQRIDAHLALLGTSDSGIDLKLVLDKIQELYNTERNKLFRNTQLIKSLDYLLKLSRLDEDDDCNEKVLEILEHNNHGTEGKASEKWYSKRKNGRPIDVFVHKYFISHAERCKQVYMDRFGRIMLPNDLEQLVSYLKELINKRLVMSFKYDSPYSNKGEHTFKLNTVISELTDVEPLSMNSGGLILHGLAELLIRNNDTENKNHLDNLLNHRNNFDEKGFKQLIGKYLVEPCQAYVKLYGPNMFEMVLFDYKVMKQTYIEVDQNLLDFYYAWANYKLCKQASSDGLDKLVDMLLEFCQRRLPK